MRMNRNIMKNENTVNYRLSYFEYRGDFDGRFAYGGARTGYLDSTSTLKLRGWLVPNFTVDNLSLVLQIIENGSVISERVLSQKESPDVAKKLGESSLTKNARFLEDIDCQFLSANEYVIRLCLKGKSRSEFYKIFDLALIKDEVKVNQIFVVGSPRAGTTALGNALRISLSARNYGEHHFLELTNQLNKTIDSFFNNYHTRNDIGTFIFDVSPALVKAKISQQTKELYSTWSDGNWCIDKTPGRNMLRSLPVVAEIWPEAKIIYCKRRAYENVKSRLAKFPGLNLQEHAKQWSETMNIWHEIKKHLTPKSYFEIDQHDMRNTDESFIAFLNSFLSNQESLKVVETLQSIEPQKSNYKDTEFNYQDVLAICRNEIEKNGYSTDINEYYK